MNTKFKITEMHCVNCSQTIERSLNKTKGIKSAVVNFALEVLNVEYDEKIMSDDEIIKLVHDLGYKAQKIQPELKKNLNSGNKKESSQYKSRFILSLFLAIPVFIIAMADMLFKITFPYSNYILFILATIIQFYVGWDFYKGAYYAIKNSSANMDVLIVLGTSAAYFYSIYLLFSGESMSYFETSSLLIAFVILGKYLEERAKQKTSEAIKKLMNLAPKIAIVLRKDKNTGKLVELEINIDEVQINDIVLIKPGSKIPVDGIIIDGNSSVDESTITGESMPVEKSKNELVIAGTLNKQGFLKVKATKTSKETVLAHIIKLIEDAQTKKAPIQRFADVISNYFVPVVLIIAIISFLLWYFAFQKEFSFALMIAISILVIACPCALGLATPTAIIVGTGLGAKKGILIKGGDSLEKLHKAKNIVFDKTGTLTYGKPELTNIVSFSKLTNKEILEIVYSLEKKSEHPLAEAITNYAKTRKIDHFASSAFSALFGFGVKAKIKTNKDRISREYYFGNLKLAKLNKLVLTPEQKYALEELENDGKTVMILSSNKNILGAVAVADKLKENARDVVHELKKQGLNVYLITGDNEKTAKAIAREAEILEENVYFEVLPQQKLQHITNIQKSGATIMVGDGINDAPALAQADISIAMGSGTDVAIETGNVVLMRNDISDIISAIKLSRATIKKIKQNMFWALFYNSLGIPIAAGILYLFGVAYLLNPIIAGGAMALSSVSVVTNSLLLKGEKI